MIRKWQRQRRNKKVLEGVARTILSKYTYSGTDESQVLEFARKLSVLDRATAESIPAFIETASDSDGAGRNVVRIIATQDHAAESLRILMTHFEALLETKFRKSGYFAEWIMQELVQRHRLGEWRLPAEREWQIIDLIITLSRDGKLVGNWVTPFLVTNPDKRDRAMEMLREREVPTLQDMEALLDDDTPMVMQSGAL